jgi:hypothetical protein
MFNNGTVELTSDVLFFLIFKRSLLSAWLMVLFPPAFGIQIQLGQWTQNLDLGQKVKKVTKKEEIYGKPGDLSGEEDSSGA